jgi:hypothetical protein
MAFRVSDLVINVVPQTTCQGETVPIDCGGFTSCQGLSDFCDFTSCQGVSDMCGIVTMHCRIDTVGGGGGGGPCKGCTLNVTPAPCRCMSGPATGLCPNCSNVRTIGGGGGVSAHSLAALKAELQRELAAVEAQEEALAARMQPQTVEEVDALEQKLTEALDELKARKKELGGKGSKGSS